MAAGQRRAARCVLLRYQAIQSIPMKRFLKLWDEWTNLCLKRSVGSRDVKRSLMQLSVVNGKNALLGEKARHGLLMQTQ